jgi:flagellin-like protein
MQQLNPLRARIRARRRGVSPIIATILLVAITVVLAAVLYVLISGLTHTGASTPYTLGMSSPTQSNPAAGIYYNAITISPQNGLTTGMFGLALKSPGGTSIAVGTAPAACKWVVAGTAFSSTNCGAPTGTWYVVLYWLGNGSIANVYTSGGWSTPTFPVTNSEQLVVVSGATLAGTSDTLSAFSTGSSSVSGQSGPF